MTGPTTCAISGVMHD